MEETTYENAVNEELREIHRMVETVRKDPEVGGMRIQLVEDVIKLSEEKARLEKEIARVMEKITMMSEETARMSEETARMSEENARISEENARISEENAKLREELARRNTVENAGHAWPEGLQKQPADGHTVSESE